MHFPTLACPLVSLFLLSLPGPASAAHPLCLEVHADRDAASLRRLALVELGRHPAYRVVKNACGGKLNVELFSVAGQRYLTVRLNQAVPTRDKVTSADLADRLGEAIALALQNDPVQLLQDPSRLSALQRLADSVLRRGQTLIRLELYQTISAAGAGGAAFAPGGAVAVTRGAGHWQVLARAYFAGAPGGVAGASRLLRVHGGAEAGLAWEWDARASTTFYLAATAGLQFLRFEGRLPGEVGGNLESAQRLGLALGGRIGLRFFRVNRFDGDLFLSAYLPCFRTHDPDTELIDAYTPSFQLGVGVGF